MFKLEVPRIQLQEYDDSGAFYLVTFKRIPRGNPLSPFLEGEILSATKMLSKFRKIIKEVVKEIKGEILGFDSCRSDLTAHIHSAPEIWLSVPLPTTTSCVSLHLFPRIQSCPLFGHSQKSSLGAVYCRLPKLSELTTLRVLGLSPHVHLELLLSICPSIHPLKLDLTMEPWLTYVLPGYYVDHVALELTTICLPLHQNLTPPHPASACWFSFWHSLQHQPF